IAEAPALGGKVNALGGVLKCDAVERDASLGSPTESGDRLQKRRLPGARRAQHGHRRARAPRGDLKSEVGERQPQVELDHADRSRARRRSIHSVDQTAAKATTTVTPTRRR